MTAASLLGVVAAVLGLAGLALGVGAAAGLRRLLGAGSPADAGPGDVVAARGPIERTGEAVVAPVSGESCTGYVLAQQLYYRWGRLPVRRWQTHRVWQAVPSFVVDGDERVRVRLGRGSREPVRAGDRSAPGDAFSDLQLERDSVTRRHEAGESPPDGVSAAVDADLPDHPHRYAEWRLDAGREVTVVGTLAEGDPPTITDDGPVFALSAGSSRGAALALAARAAAYLLFGLGALVVAALQFPELLG